MSASARERAASRLDRALAASGALRDECASPLEPSLMASRKLGMAKSEISSAEPDSRLEEDSEVDAGGLEAVILLGSAAVQQQCLERVQPADELIAACQRISQKLEAMQTDSLKTRNLLREVEAMVSRAIDEADDDDDAAAPPPRATTATGGRLPPSRAPGGMALSARPGASVSGRHAAAKTAWSEASQSLSAPSSTMPSARGVAPGGGSVLASTARGSANVDLGDRRGLDETSGGLGGVGGGIFGLSAEQDAEVIRAKRLLRCEEMEATGVVLRERVDGLSVDLSAAADANAQLASRLENALDFSFDSSELEAEMARVEAEERAADRELATSARERIRARSQLAAERLSRGSPRKRGAAAAQQQLAVLEEVEDAERVHDDGVGDDDDVVEGERPQPVPAPQHLTPVAAGALAVRGPPLPGSSSSSSSRHP